MKDEHENIQILRVFLAINQKFIRVHSPVPARVKHAETSAPWLIYRLRCMTITLWIVDYNKLYCSPSVTGEKTKAVNINWCSQLLNNGIADNTRLSKEQNKIFLRKFLPQSLQTGQGSLRGDLPNLRILWRWHAPGRRKWRPSVPRLPLGTWPASAGWWHGVLPWMPWATCLYGGSPAIPPRCGASWRVAVP